MKDLQKNSAVDWALLSIRVIVGIIFIAHGMQKVFGSFDGPGLAAVVQQMGPIGYLVSFGELLGGLGLLVGFLTRFSALSLIVVMIGAIAMVHGKNGFFMQTSGFEYCLALLGMLLPILIAGPGRFAASELIPVLK
ncbi:MAG: DoxX family protein, partial [Fimbriimonas sp.]